MISARTFVEKIWEYPPDRTIELPVELQKTLEENGKSELEAIAITEETMSRVKLLIQKRIHDCESKRVTPNFRFSEQSEDRLIGVLAAEKKEQMKGKLHYRKELQEFICNLSWKTFENLCLYIMQLCQFKKYALGNRTRDGGLDFFGLYAPQSLTKYKGFLTEMSFRIFGQAKQRNKSSVTGDEIRSFYTHYKDFLDAKGLAYNYVGSNCTWFLDAKGPLVAMIVTNGHFAKGAEDFAEKKGIIIREGAQIVEDIVQLSKNETWLTLRGGKYFFAPERLKSYLNSLADDTRPK